MLCVRVALTRRSLGYTDRASDCAQRMFRKRSCNAKQRYTNDGQAIFSTLRWLTSLCAVQEAQKAQHGAAHVSHHCVRAVRTAALAAPARFLGRRRARAARLLRPRG